MKERRQTLLLWQRIQDLGLIPHGAKVLIGVSGGCDSIALLHLLHGMAGHQKWHLSVAHLHHGIRGASADDDLAFVQAQAQTLGLACHVGRAAVSRRSRSSPKSVEMLAREARHQFFTRLVRRHHYEVVALAHTSDDQAETVLLRMIRGSGTQGLGGMAERTPLGPLQLVRPLLTTAKMELKRWLAAEGHTWREDETNQEDIYLRNRVRSTLLPLLQQDFNPDIVSTLSRTAAALRSDRDILAERAAEDLGRISANSELNVPELNRLSPARRRRALLCWMQTAGVELDQSALNRIEKLCQSVRGTARVAVGSGRTVIRQYAQLRLANPAAERKTETAGRSRLACPGRTELLGWRVEVECKQGFRKPRNESVGQWPSWTYISAKRVGRSPLHLRPIRPGDRFAPLGMAGHRKLQDILVDLKVPFEQRDQLMVLECRAEIIWIPGYRVARGWAVKGSDDPSLRIRVEKGKRT